MSHEYEGNAIVYCEGAFNTTNGKTAHGLARRSERYRVTAVVDSRYAGSDAGEVLDGRASGIPIVADLAEAIELSRRSQKPATHLVVGLAPDGGRLEPGHRKVLLQAIREGLNLDSGLHDLLGEDAELVGAATRAGVVLRDVRRTPGREELHFFTGRIEEVQSLRVAVLGTDSAVGKRTTAWMLVDAFRAMGRSCELIGTGQTAWLQGARYSIVMDSIINDFVAGEIEHAVVSAWDERRPDALILEGQGSLMNPAYPGGFELLAAGRPHAVVLQHAPSRVDYDGFPGNPVHPLSQQIQAVELISGKPVVAITLNHEDLPREELESTCERIRAELGLPVCDPLVQGVEPVMKALEPYLTTVTGGKR
jgi:uncharacterized NAD-dependent epimerase/dehydratase family protein